MKKTQKVAVLCASLAAFSTGVFGGQMYEWRDPATGRLMLGDKPPDGVDHWEEGKRKPGELVPTPVKPQAPPVVREATEQEVNECLDFLKSRYSFKDESSLRIEGRRLTVMYENGDSTVALSVNGKNSYGAYAGVKQVLCKYPKNGDKELFYADQ